MSMIILPRSEYWKISEPLKRIPFNTFFARTVAEGRLPGSIHVDNMDEPATILIAHPYGMSLLFGDAGNADFNRSLHGYMMNTDKQRSKSEWLQAYPNSWKSVIEGILGQNLLGKDAAREMAPSTDDAHHVKELTRVNFRFNEKRFRKNLGDAAPLPDAIVRTTLAMFYSIQGQVVPRYFWRDAEQFSAEGAGFSRLANGVPASTAFSAFVANGILEIGIETVPEHRGKGYAEQASRALIQHCLDNGLEPVWSCRLENAASFSLAEKLGFEPTLFIPYYQLVVG
ncbi:MAG: GNAT family N-acetyltransferase [Thermoplasmata archaeon]